MVEVFGTPGKQEKEANSLCRFDRDLTLAGRVLVATKEGFESRLVYIDRPILRVPSLAIHLDRGANDGFAPNKETNLIPVLGSSIKQYVASSW